VRLLFDEHLSEALVGLLADVFPASLHVRLLGAGGATDREIWQLARDNGCALVTKDGDFHRLSVMLGAPPKIIWVKVGNCTTSELADLLRARSAAMQSFGLQEEETVLELG